MTMHLAVVGGNAWFSGALDALLNRDGNLWPVEIATDPACLRDGDTGKPRIAILAADLGRTALISTIADWKRRYPGIRVVVRLRALRPELVRDTMQAGAWGCFAEDDAPEVVLGLLKSVQGGRMSFPFVDFAKLRDDPFEQLTRREHEVLAALSKGWTNGQISARLGVSENTVKYHLKLIYEKLGVKNRSMAVAEYLNYTNA
ncbi:response regulator transcription factor [Rhodobacteraceae bacterium NNCM2]|nr:response regulator transcription factor [Coraliihabitans acroporae]